MDADTLRKKPACVLRRDAWLTELRQLEDRESLRPWLHKYGKFNTEYGCFQKKSTWSSPGVVHLDNLKELAKRFRLHKSIPNFFRDYTTEDSLVAVLKRYVRNNAAFLSLTPSVASARRAGHPQTDTGGMVGADGGDGQHAIRKASSIDSASLLEGGGNTASGSLTTTAAGDGEHPHRTTGAAGGNAYTRVLSSEALQPDGAGRGAIGHTSRAPGIASSGVPHTTRAGRGRRTSSSQPRRVLQPKRPTKGSIILNPNAGGRKLFGYSNANTMSGMIQMSRMGLSSHNIDRLSIICRQDQRGSASSGPLRATTETGQRVGGTGTTSAGGAAGGGDSSVLGPASSTRQSIMTPPGGSGVGTSTKQRAAGGGEDEDGGRAVEEARGRGWKKRESGDQRLIDRRLGDDDYSEMLKIKAAQALFRMSLEPGGEMKLVQDGVVVALVKLIGVENSTAHRLVSGCLANLTTRRDVTWELLQANGHQVLAFLINGVKTPDLITLGNVATALCRCTYEARNHERLVTEFNTTQALCYIMQRQTASLKIASVKGMLNLCGLSSDMPALAAKLDVYMLTLSSALEDLARNDKEAIQTFVCRGIQGLTSVQACLSRIPDSGIVDLLLPLAKMNQKRPRNLARLASATVNLANLQSAHAQLVKQKDLVAVMCLLCMHHKLIESCCVAAASLSRTRGLETLLAPLATALVETNLPNEASVDCVAFLLQNVTRGHPMSKPSVTSWLAIEANSASADGRLACLSAIEHLLRNQEDVDTPFLKAGLMDTLHSVLKEPTPSLTEEQPQDPGQQPTTAASGSAAAAAASPGAAPSSRVDSSSSSSTTSSGLGAGAVISVKAMVAKGRQRRKHRANIIRSRPDALDRVLKVVTKICFSLTLRAKNRPRLVQHGLPALCAKVLKLTTDGDIKFMASACIFGLSQSPELCPDIAESGAADLALQDLALCRPGEESEFLLTQLAVVAQMAGEPRFSRCLKSPATVDLLMRLALGGSGEDANATVVKVAGGGGGGGGGDGGAGGDGPTSNQTESTDATADVDGRPHDGSSDNADGDRLEHEKRDSTGFHADSAGAIDGNGWVAGGERGGGGGSGSSGSGIGDTAMESSSSTSHAQQQSLLVPLPKIKVASVSVKVASAYMGALRYCVVTIAERLGSTLDQNVGVGRPSSPWDLTNTVRQLVHIVCSVVLSSGPDEALMRRCARVMSDWSTDPKFAREMSMKTEAGNSIAVLMRSVAPKTRVLASMALCNVAGEIRCQTPPSANRDGGRLEAGKSTNTREDEAAGRNGSGDNAESITNGSDNNNNNNNNSRSKNGRTAGGRDGGGICDGVEGRQWLESTTILQEIITGALASASAEVKGNLIKTLNNLMCSKSTRAALVADNKLPALFQLVRGNTPEIRELAAGVLFNLTCERALHPALLAADIASTLLELLCPSQRGVSRESAGSRNSEAARTTAAAVGGGGGGGGGGGERGGGGGGGNAATTDDTHGASTTGPPKSDGVESSGDANVDQKKSSFENEQESGAGVETSGREEGSGTTPLAIAPDVMADGHITTSAAKGTRVIDSDPTSGPFNKHRSNDDMRGISGTKGLPGGGGSSDSIAGGSVMAQRPSLQVRRNVLGAVMNLTTSSLEHQRLDPSAVMCLLTLIIHEDPNESQNEIIAGNLWVAWQAVILQLSFVERYRALIVYHGEGEVFQHMKVTNDLLSGKSSVMTAAHDRAYKRLIMGTMVNIACEPSLYEELEGQVQVLREFLSEYEQEASGGCASGTSGGAGPLGVILGNSARGSRGNGLHGDTEDAGKGDKKGASGGIGGPGGANGGGGDAGGSGTGGGEIYSRGRDWVRHELCGMLVSNLFSSKTLREKLSKKPIGGILVGLLCGPPVRSSNNSNRLADSTLLPRNNSNTSALVSRSNVTKDTAFPRSERSMSYGAGDDGEAAASLTPNVPSPEGYNDPQPMLYGGGEEAAAIASRFLCEISVLYAAEGGFELPQRSFEAMVKIAHYYNYNAPAWTMSSLDVSEVLLETDPTSGEEEGNSSVRSTTPAAADGGASPPDNYSLEETNNDPIAGGGGGEERVENNNPNSGHHHLASITKPFDEQPQKLKASTALAAAVPVDDRRRGRTSSTASASATTPAKAVDAVGRDGGPGIIIISSSSGNSPRPSEGIGNGRQQPPSLAAPVQSSSKSIHSGDDRHVETQPGVRPVQGNSNATGVGGRRGPEWASRARELTRLWVRAVGSLCCPSHSELWVPMIDAGMIGALNRCVCSAALSDDDEGLAICSSALRNLSTATAPRSLRSERAAACFGCAKQLLACCPDQPQVQVDCAAAMVNFVDASQVQDLEDLDVVGLLGKYCTWEEEEGAGDGDCMPSKTLVWELAVYSLSKLCTRDFVPKGERVVSTITTMMDFNPQTIKRLDDVVKSLVHPSLPPRGPWKFLQPNKDLGATVLPLLDKRFKHQRSTDSGQGRAGDAASASRGGQSEEDSKLPGGSVRWELQLFVGGEENAEPPTLPRARVPAALLQLSKTKAGRTLLGPNKRQSAVQDPAGNTAGANKSTPLPEGDDTTEEGGSVSTPGGGSTGIKGEGPSAEGGKPAAGGGGGRKGFDSKQMLRRAAAKLTAVISETAVAANAFSSKADGPVNVENRILRNPVLTADDPPFELPWLLKHDNTDRLRLLQKSLSGTPSTSLLSSPMSTLQGDNAGSKHKQLAGTSTGENIGLAHPTARRDSEQKGDSTEGRGAGAEPPATPDDVGFNVLTVSDEKWTNPDLPPEAGKQQQKRAHGSSTGAGSVGGGSTRPGGGGRGQGTRKSTGGNSMSLLLQQAGSLPQTMSQRR